MVETAIAIAGLLIAWFTYKKTYLDKPKEEIQHLVLQFKATQSLSLKVRGELIAYAEKNSAYDNDLFPGITIGTYIIMLKESFEKNLSDELLESVLKLNPPKLTLISMTQSLEKQFSELTILENMRWSTELSLNQRK